MRIRLLLIVGLACVAIGATMAERHMFASSRTATHPQALVRSSAASGSVSLVSGFDSAVAACGSLASGKPKVEFVQSATARAGCASGMSVYRELHALGTPNAVIQRMIDQLGPSAFQTPQP
jgi:hypothetical protein